MQSDFPQAQRHFENVLRAPQSVVEVLPLQITNKNPKKLWYYVAVFESFIFNDIWVNAKTSNSLFCQFDLKVFLRCDIFLLLFFFLHFVFLLFLFLFFVIGCGGSPELKMFFICFSALCWCVLSHRRTLDFHGWRDTLPQPTMCSTPFTVETLSKNDCRYQEWFLPFSLTILPLFFHTLEPVAAFHWTDFTASVKLSHLCGFRNYNWQISIFGELQL